MNKKSIWLLTVLIASGFALAAPPVFADDDDCSGPLIRRGDPKTYGIAMLDHPSNRNHPNAWFARSYGPLGTNLPFFDGPLTLQAGETWSLRHRIVIHEGGPEEADIQQRFDEYAASGLLTVI